jgi:hypothetical protein
MDVSKWPAADYNSSEPVDEKSRHVRETKGKNFDKSKFEVNPASGSDNHSLTHSETDLLPPLPVPQSDAVVIGDVVAARAYLSNDKTGVYSEFDIAVVESIKQYSVEPLSPGDSITVMRDGGRVRLPSGRVQLYSISKERMPEVRQRYILFLRRLDGGQGFRLLTAYALKNGKVVPLDGHSQFKTYQDTDEANFVDRIRETAMKSSQPMPK